MATGQRFWHGGRLPSDGVLLPQAVMRSGRPGDGWVYVTTDRHLALTYAATLPGSWLMEVDPVGPLEHDPESIFDYSFRCRSARVLRRFTISNSERAAINRVMSPLLVGRAVLL